VEPRERGADEGRAEGWRCYRREGGKWEKVSHAAFTAHYTQHRRTQHSQRTTCSIHSMLQGETAGVRLRAW